MFCLHIGKKHEKLTVPTRLPYKRLPQAGPKDDLDESGWKMVSGDVFRCPKDAVLLCVQVGSGVQIISSATLTLVFAALGKSPHSSPLLRLTPPPPTPTPTFLLTFL